MKMRGTGFLFVLSCLLMMLCAVPEAAADTAGVFPDSPVSRHVPEPTVVTQIETGKWVKKNGYYYYYRGKKKLKKGIYEIGSRKYCFDKKGRQLTGWRKVGKKVYYFRCKNGKKGYMLTGQEVNGIRLKKTGRAAPKSERAKRKLKILLRARKIADKAVRPTMKKKAKLRACFEYVQKYYRSFVMEELGNSKGSWDLNYAEYMMDHGGGDCYGYAYLFAYLAVSIGCKDVLCVNNGMHGWAEIDGKFYDPHWDLWIKVDCFATPASESGTGGRPHWVGHRHNIKNCDK